MLGLGDIANKRGDQAKDVTDFLIGVTQVLNRHTIVQFNYSLSQSDGYLTDPYKVLSVVDPVTGNPVPARRAAALPLSVREPPRRSRQAECVALVKRDFDGDVLDASYRYMTDDWGVDSHTLELRYRWSFGTSATCSRTCGSTSRPRPTSIALCCSTARRCRLCDGRSSARRVRRAHRRAQVRAATARGGEWSARIEYYTQSGIASPGRVGALADFDSTPI